MLCTVAMIYPILGSILFLPCLLSPFCQAAHSMGFSILVNSSPGLGQSKPTEIWQPGRKRWRNWVDRNTQFLTEINQIINSDLWQIVATTSCLLSEDRGHVGQIAIVGELIQSLFQHPCSNNLLPSSTKPQLQLFWLAELVLFPFDPVTHPQPPAGTHYVTELHGLKHIGQA